MSRQPDQRLSYLNDQYGYYPSGQNGSANGGYHSPSQGQAQSHHQAAQVHGQVQNQGHSAYGGYGYQNQSPQQSPHYHQSSQPAAGASYNYGYQPHASQYSSYGSSQGHVGHQAGQQSHQAAGHGGGHGSGHSGYSSMPPLPAVLQQEERIVAALQNMFPEFPQTTLRTAARVRGTFEQAAEWLATMKRQGMMQGGMPKQAPMRPTMSIRDKFRQPGAGGLPQGMTPQQAAHQQQQIYAQQQMYAQQHAVQQQQQQRAMPAQYQPKKKLVKKVDEDDFSASDDSDSEVEYDAAGQRQFEERVLYFLNTAPKSAIIDVAGCTEEMVDILIKKRPYQTLTQASKVDIPSNVQHSAVRRRGALKKSAGSKIVDASLSTLRGYEAVDSLIQECATLGKNVKDGIHQWGIDISGSNELDVTEINSNSQSTFFTEKPALLSPNFELKNYQVVGINWLSLLYNKGLSCILADEMGLGKTCQVISFLAHLREKGERGPHLVVCPSSTLENWLRELNRFCPSLVIEPYYGNQTERTEMRENIIENGVHFDVMVTTYNLATGGKQDLGFLKSLKFNVCVYDEGHLLKNSQSERYNKLMKLKANFRVLLTGTPLQNNLRELVSLLSFILPNLFEQNKDDLLEVFKFKAKTQNQESTERSQLLSEQRIVKAKTMMAPFVLRRRKAQVLQHLPAKSHEIVHCEMLPAQREMYLREFSRNRSNIKHANEEVKADSAAGKSKTRKGRQATIALDNVLMKLRQVALHPLLFRNLYTDEKLQRMAEDIMQEERFKASNQTYIFEDMQVMNDFELNRLCHNYPASIGQWALDDNEYMQSGKIQKLTEMIVPMKAQGDRILIFSQFTKMLDVMEKVLDKINFKYLRLDGQTPVEVRQDMIDKYYEDDSITVFLLSTKAGGFGINLACANVVIIFDLSFNPHDDKQAEDRAHRVGQTRAVKVIRMVTKDTIEENIMELANTKLALDRHVSEENENDVDGESEALVADMVLEDGSTRGGTPSDVSIGTPNGSASGGYMGPGAGGAGPSHGIFNTPTPQPPPTQHMPQQPSYGMPHAPPTHHAASAPMASLMAPYMPPKGTPPPRPIRKAGRPPTRRKAVYDSDLSDDDGDISDSFSDLEAEPTQPVRRSSRRAAAQKAQEAAKKAAAEEDSDIEPSGPPSYMVVLKYTPTKGPQQAQSISQAQPQQPSQVPQIPQVSQIPQGPQGPQVSQTPQAPQAPQASQVPQVPQLQQASAQPSPGIPMHHQPQEPYAPSEQPHEAKSENNGDFKQEDFKETMDLPYNQYQEPYLMDQSLGQLDQYDQLDQGGLSEMDHFEFGPEN